MRILWSLQALKVMAHLATGDRIHLYRLCKTLGLKLGVAHPILKKFEAAGFITSERDRTDPALVARAGNPSSPRIYYKVTEKGRSMWRELCALVQQAA